jgi:hypothetical protein
MRAAFKQREGLREPDGPVANAGNQAAAAGSCGHRALASEFVIQKLLRDLLAERDELEAVRNETEEAQ